VLTGELLSAVPTQPVARVPGAFVPPEPQASRLEVAAPVSIVSSAQPKPEPEPEPERAPTPPNPGARSPVGVPLESIEALAREIAAAGEAGRRVTVVGAVRNVGTTIAAVTLARALSRTGRVVLVDLALGSPNLSVIASDPTAPGIADLIRGSASFGEIITRDRHSRVHLVMAGRGATEAQAIVASQRLAITLEALARTYDHLIIDAGALPELAAERFVQFAPRAVLIATELEDLVTIEARERLIGAGFVNVSVLVNQPHGQRAQAAA
jgi:polysaccharide biosynthesis transport protein